MVSGDPLFNSRRLHLALLALLALLAVRHGIPAAYSSRGYPESGGLMSYGTDVTDAFRQLGVYAGRVLKGGNPAEMAMEEPRQFRFVLNMKTAREIGLEIPPAVRLRADEVIE